MRVDAQLKKESSFSSLTLFGVSLLVSKWMTLGNQVFMIRSSVFLHSRAILFCRLLQSTGPEALNQQKPKSNQKETWANLHVKYPCYPLCAYLSSAVLHSWCFSLPAHWKINQDQWRKCHVADIQDGLHYRMKNVQICFYNLAASDKAIMPRLGEIKNSVKDCKCILQKGIKKMKWTY